jgi:hypothetical protein
MILLKEKHRVAPAPLMTVAQYLHELRTMIQELSAQVEASLEAASASTGPAAEAAERERDGWIRRLEALQRTLTTHENVNPEKLIADWEVYCMNEVVEVSGVAGAVLCFVIGWK